MKDITIDPEILGGLPVFTGTRVPVQALFDYLEGGDSLDDFLESYPDVPREQAVRMLEASKRNLLQEAGCGSHRRLPAGAIEGSPGFGRGRYGVRTRLATHEERRASAAAQGQFDVLLTMDKGMPDQQKPSRFRVAVVILRVSLQPPG